MKREDKKAALTAYKERKVVAGIYAVRCGHTGQRWIGRAPDLSTIQNRVWFSLRRSGNPYPTLQAAWHEHGADCFTFEVVEQLDEEPDAYFRNEALKARLAHWCAELRAEAI